MDVEASSGRIDLTLRQRPKAEVVAFGKLMAALALMKSREALGSFHVELYEDQLADVPLSILTRGIQRALDMGGWRPDPGELKQICESVRLELRDASKFEGCAQCDGTGWETITLENVQRVRRCWCWKAHQEKLAELAGPQPLALPERLALPSGEDD